jgi:hypothetical protein
MWNDTVVEEDRSCQVSVTSSPIHIARPSSISSANTGRLHCGAKSQPWLLEAPAGQRINISFLDFTPANAESSPHNARQSNVGGCAKHQYGYIIEKSVTAVNKKNISLCTSLGSKRFNNIYLSTSNHVEIVFSPDLDWNTISTFLIRIEGLLKFLKWIWWDTVFLKKNSLHLWSINAPLIFYLIASFMIV